MTVPAPQTEAVASALVFDPPVIANEPVLQLDREAREIAAFAGYHETITTFFYLRVHDRQILDDHGRYERRAISESIGVSYR